MPKAKKKSGSAAASHKTIQKTSKVKRTLPENELRVPNSKRSKTTKSRKPIGPKRIEFSDMTSSSTETRERENHSVTKMQPSSKSWKPLRMSTKTYALQLLDSAAELLLSRTTSDAFDEVQGQLTVMRERFSDMLDKESGPESKIISYSSLHKLMKSQQGENDYRTLEALETQLAKEEIECIRLEKDIEACSLYADGASSVHPILQFKPEDKT